MMRGKVRAWRGWPGGQVAESLVGECLVGESGGRGSGGRVSSV